MFLEKMMTAGERRLRIPGRALALAALAVFFLSVAVAGWRVSRALRHASEEIRSEREISVVVRLLPASAGQEFEVVSSPAVFVQAAQFQGHLYLTGPAGLLEYDSGGSLLKRYAVGRELPSSSLVAMAPAVLADSHEPELVIATAQQGILAFNGRLFRQIYPNNGDARTITSVLPLGTL